MAPVCYVVLHAAQGMSYQRSRKFIHVASKVVWKNETRKERDKVKRTRTVEQKGASSLILFTCRVHAHLTTHPKESRRLKFSLLGVFQKGSRHGEWDS